MQETVWRVFLVPLYRMWEEYAVYDIGALYTIFLKYDDNRFIITKNNANIFTILVNLFLL